MSSRRIDLVVWFGLLGGPLAWAVQFVANLFIGIARCGGPAPRWQVPVAGPAIVLSLAAIAVGLVATAASLSVYRRTRYLGQIHYQVLRGRGGAPPAARIHFLAICGLVVNFLALTIIVMTGIGTPLLGLCMQS